jgi:hypothetical protein
MRSKNRDTLPEIMRALACFLSFTLVAQTVSAQEPVDLAAIHKIKAEAFQNSKVMDHLFWLTDRYGPRLAGSKGYANAATWVSERLNEYGIKSWRESFGPFGRSWEWSRFSAHMLEPSYAPLIGFPMAWTPGTKGKVTGEPLLAILKTDADLEKWKGKLRDRIVLTEPAKDIQMITQPQGRRWTDKELAERAMTPDPSRQFGGPAPAGPPVDREAQQRFRQKLMKFLSEEAPAIVVQYGYNGDGGTIFASSFGSRDMKDPVPPPAVVITPEHYNRIVRLLEKKIPVKLEFEVAAQMGDKAEDSFNVIGEIPGTSKKDEVVMIGGHLDSWHSGTGATDNATGTAVAIEAMRILKSLNVQFPRTIRIGLWGGEEQGLLGSIAYVKQHFADRADMKTKPEYNKLSVYFNSDTGTGKFRGIQLMGNEMARPIFESWMAPFRDLGLTTITGNTANELRAPGGTDHTSFDYVGLPGFGFLQDPMEYQTRTHHSNMDVYDRVQKGDLMQSAAIMAAFAYHAAMRGEMMPRKPAPKAKPWPGQGSERPAATGN